MPAAAFPGSLQGVPSGRVSTLIDRHERAGRLFEKPDQLRRRTPQQESRRFGVIIAGEQNVDRLGQKCGEIVVLEIDIESAPGTSFLPEGTGAIRPGCTSSDRMPNGQGQLHPESMKRHAAIFSLSTPLRRLSGDPRGAVREDHGSLDLVAILAPGSTPPRGLELTLSFEIRRIEGRGMASRRQPALFLIVAAHEKRLPSSLVGWCTLA